LKQRRPDAHYRSRRPYVATESGESPTCDNPKDIGKSDRIRASQQPHEVKFIAKKFKITGQAASGAIRAAGPMRANVYDYIRRKKKNGEYA
jgi:Protein of unknown function (DUF3606)